MKKLLTVLVLLLCSGHVLSQKTLVVEKIGTSRKYFYHTGDYMKLRVSKEDTLLTGRLWHIGENVITINSIRALDVRITDIGSVYKRFSFPKKFATYMAFGGAGIFVIIAFNHLINNEQVFTQDMFIISGSMLALSAVSFSLSQKRCNTGDRWKVKVLNIMVN